MQRCGEVDEEHGCHLEGRTGNLGYKAQGLGAHHSVPASKPGAGCVLLHPHALPGHVTHLTASFLKYSFLL